MTNSPNRQVANMEEHLIATISNENLIPNLVSTVLLILAFFLVKYFASRSIVRLSGLPAKTRRRWLVNLRASLLLLTIACIGAVWASEIHKAAISLAALAVAMVVGTKELILCLLGSVLKTVSDSFSIGDRIEVDGFKGDVIDQTPLSTTLMEVGPGSRSHQQTGRAVVIPNSIFLTKEVVNESYSHEYVLHAFTVPMSRDGKWKKAEQDLIRIASEECAPFLDEAKEFYKSISLKKILDAPSVEPRVILIFPDANSIELLIRICVPGRQKGKIEQNILRKFMDTCYADV